MLRSSKTVSLFRLIISKLDLLLTFFCFLFSLLSISSLSTLLSCGSICIEDFPSKFLSFPSSFFITVLHRQSFSFFSTFSFYFFSIWWFFKQGRLVALSDPFGGNLNSINDFLVLNIGWRVTKDRSISFEIGAWQQRDQCQNFSSGHNFMDKSEDCSQVSKKKPFQIIHYFFSCNQ